MVCLRWILAITAFLSVTECAKILVVFPIPGKSHSILGEGIVRLLLEAKHSITFISPFEPKSHPNLTWIDVSSNIKLMSDDLLNVTAVLEKKVDLTDPAVFFSFMLDLANSTYSHENVQKLLLDPDQKFDAAIFEWLFTEIVSGLSAVLDCPYIWVSTIEPHSGVLSLIDEGLNPSYNADHSSTYSPPFTFWQRVTELWISIRWSAIKRFYIVPKESQVYEEVFGPIMAKKGKTLPPFNEVRHNASLMLGNSHPSMGDATRLPQNYKAIGGYHIEHKVKPLPEDLKRILDNAKNGLIYFSMGSNLKSKDLPDRLKRDLLKMFGSLKYTVIWKFEEVLNDLPKNVHILQWAPQASILAHPNTVLFITHGGLLSTTETLHFGVPIIGIPVFADQFINVYRAVNKGFAIKVDLSYSLADELKVAIAQILSNPRYKEKVKELSMVYHDRPVSPGAELVHWVGHVVRTRGAPHLRSPAMLLPWYQKYYIDLAALILAVLIVVYSVLKRLFCSKKRVSSQKKKN